jgi:colanic acid/amylovoran biosynthesis glycosyltransferase
VTVLMAHSNPARIENGRLKIDRKFLAGMQDYAKRINAPLITAHPVLAEDRVLMDAVEVPCAELPFRVMTVEVDGWGQTRPADVSRLRNEISRSKLVYGDGLGATTIAQALRVPYIRVLEYDLRTQIVVAASGTNNPLRRANAAIQCGWHYFATTIPEMRHAHSLHCNGYPTYDASEPHNRNRLLYFDSRMSRELLMPAEQLAARLAGRAGRTLRLLYSGRYEHLKGAGDVVRVGLECLRRGLDVEMHLYGRGSLRPELEQLASRPPAAGRIHVHDAVPYPELVRISHTFDLFVCCHIQNDPSCTYLESFGAGLPIVGYGNRMWRGLAEHSGAGVVTPLGDPGGAADGIQRLAADHAALAALSSKALTFAAEHCFEREFAKRTEALNAALQ